ncbi:MAG TPA: carbonic anhydrase family protein [Terracidiphilus sp.]|nr:carbonic anhydrase family protein [Terracidiphilus sp.]
MRKPVLCALALALTSLAAAQTPVPWAYKGRTGPMNWGKLDPAYRACSAGRQQSPIDIRHAHLNKALKPIDFHYLAGPATLENTGRTVMVHVDPGSYILVDGVRYNLLGFDFHSPSEEAVKGRLTDMDVQLIHKSADGKYAIIAVRLVENMDAPNATLAMLWEQLPTTPGAKGQVTAMVNAGGLLPADRGYWTYTGSLTTPPCTEGVRWFVMENSISIGRAQYRAFTTLYPMNSRPLQDSHGRRIEANE